VKRMLFALPLAMLRLDRWLASYLAEHAPRREGGTDHTVMSAHSLP
jgi:two-component system sensor histidine kinase EvgS